MSESTVLKLVNLTKKYHDLIAVNNLNLEIHKGEILGFVGPNGAGKTTTMKMMGGLITPTLGHIELNNLNGDYINVNEVPNQLYKRFGFLIDIPSFYGQATAFKILKYYCKLLGVSKNQIDDQIDWALKIVEMAKWKHKKLEEYSKGMTQRLGLAQAIVHDPEVLILDEPQTGLDPGARIQVRNIIKKLNTMGKTIFLSSHLLYEISEVCNRIAIINEGELITVDKIMDLEQRMTKKEIIVELLNPVESNRVNSLSETILSRIKQYGLADEKASLRYDEDLPGFHIYYDGTPTSRKEIHDILSLELKLPIIGFSRIRTSALEDIYVDLVEKNHRDNSLDDLRNQGGER